MFAFDATSVVTGSRGFHDTDLATEQRCILVECSCNGNKNQLAKPYRFDTSLGTRQCVVLAKKFKSFRVEERRVSDVYCR